MQILLAVDGSDCSTRAAQYLAQHFNMFATPIDLYVFHVEPGIPIGLAAMQARALLGKEVIDQYTHSEAMKALAPAEKLFSEAKITFRSGYRVGQPAEEICRMAEEQRCELVVMGSRGRGAVHGLVMGSVAMKVVAASQVPVLIVR